MQAVDYRLFRFINQFAGRWHLVNTVMVTAAKYGPVLLLLALTYIWLKAGNEGKQAAILSVISLTLALIVNQILGHMYFRPRPFAFHRVNMLLPKSPDPSFPSDHATFSFAIASLIYLWNKKAGAYLIGLGVLIAFARVFVGTHYPFDVLGGALIGSVTGFTVWKLRPKLEALTLFIIGIAKKVRLA